MWREISLSASAAAVTPPEMRLLKLGGIGQQQGRAAGAGEAARAFLQHFVQSQKVVLGSVKEQKLGRRREACRFCKNAFFSCVLGDVRMSLHTARWRC